MRKLDERQHTVGTASPSSQPVLLPLLPYFMPHKWKKWENFSYSPTLYSGGILAPNPKAGNILSLEKDKEKKSSHKEIHFATINIYSPISIHQKCKAAQKRILGQECYMAEWKGKVLEKEGFMLTRWRNGIGHFSGDHLVFCEAKSTWRTMTNRDILHFSHQCNCRSILPLLLSYLAAVWEWAI